MKEVALYLVDSTNVTVREFFSPASSTLDDADAKIIGPELLKIMKKEKLTDEGVVAAARPKDSKLHGYFEWNDQTAADQFRLGQARQMIYSIRVRYVEPGAPAQPQQRPSVVAPDHSKRVVPMHRAEPRHVLGPMLHLEGEGRDQMQGVLDAMDGLQLWRRRFEPQIAGIEKMASVFEGVLAAIEEFMGDAAGIENLPNEVDLALGGVMEWEENHGKLSKVLGKFAKNVRAVATAIIDCEAALQGGASEPHQGCARCGARYKPAVPGQRLCEKCLEKFPSARKPEK